MEDLDDLSPSGLIMPSSSLGQWAWATFIDPSGELTNDEHYHLADATLLFYWSATPMNKGGKKVIGQTALPQCQGNAWTRALYERLIDQDSKHCVGLGAWPDFIITIDTYAANLTDRRFCALIEHELYHCAQAIDAFGNPKIDMETGKPKYMLRAHDVEVFIGEVRRYGIQGGDGALSVLANAILEGGTVEQSEIDLACGCGSRL